MSVLRGECARKGEAVSVKKSVMTASKRLSRREREMKRIVYARTFMRMMGNSSWKKMGSWTLTICTEGREQAGYVVWSRGSSGSGKIWKDYS